MPFAQHASISAVHNGVHTSGVDHEDTRSAENIMKRVKRVALSITATKRAKIFRLKLVERLRLEADLQRGLRRLINQTLICVFTMAALQAGGGGEDVKRGIYKHLASYFDIANFRRVQDRATLKDEFLPAIAFSAKKHSLLSSRYFNAGSRGDVELVGAREVFFSPRVLAATDLNLQVPSFSFSAWVQLDASFKTGYLIEKRPSIATYSSSVCWGWYLDSDRGPELHYGAHDSAPPAFGADNAEQESVAPDVRATFESSTNFLLTLVVDGLNVTFYKDRTATGPYQLPRKVTDCDNNHEGILVGAPGMRMAQLRFYAAALNKEEVSGTKCI